MNNNMNFSDNQLNRLMQMAGKKMGTDPEKLKQQMESGNMDAIFKNLNENQRAQLMNFMNNPQAIEQLMSNPKIQTLLKDLMRK